MKTLKSLKKTSHKVVRHFKGKTNDEVRESILKDLKKYPHITMKETSASFNFSNGRFIMKRKANKKDYGELYFRAGGDYVFTYSDGEKSYGSKIKASQLQGDKLITEYFDYEFIIV